MIQNFPSDPTGGVATRAQLADIASVIRRKAPPQAHGYSDEVYEDILFDGDRPVSIASVPGLAVRTGLVGRVSRSDAWTGGRVGCAVFLTAEEATIFENLNINSFSCIPASSPMDAKITLDSPASATVIAASGDVEHVVEAEVCVARLATWWRARACAGSWGRGEG